MAQLEEKFLSWFWVSAAAQSGKDQKREWLASES